MDIKYKDDRKVMMVMMVMMVMVVKMKVRDGWKMVKMIEG